MQMPHIQSTLNLLFAFLCVK
uniref:Uncharacterized protein n=1 Tax=Anguilla anguilla TaxID=7936 RepID=A0A0E9PI94_ANGAN